MPLIRRVVLVLVLSANVAILYLARTGGLGPVVHGDRAFALPAVSRLRVAGMEPEATALLVDDAATANPDLAPVAVHTPPGLLPVDHEVELPAGFSISLVATGIAQPRFMTFDAAGNLLVASFAGSVYRLPIGVDGGIAPVAGPLAPLISSLDGPSSLAIHAGFLYVGETHQISRYPYDPSGPVGQAEVAVPDLPVGGHATRTVVFGPDSSMYVSVGSSCNICQERDQRRAAIARYRSDGTDGERFAWGLRNAVGLAIQPSTGLLWATVNERDNQGNEVPPDLVTIVRPGDDFGWPDCQPPRARPQTPDASCSDITPPTVGIQAHSAPLGLAFYSGVGFPSEYRGDLFVAQHGSWNRQPPAEPKILRIHFEDGRPASARDFATGWQRPDGSRWGRPAGVIEAPDGSLIVSDDAGGVLYRISYSD